MADGVVTKVVGLPEFTSRIRALKSDTQTKVIRSGGLAAANVFKRDAVANAPVLQPNGRFNRARRPGALKAAIYASRSRTKSTPGKEVFVVSVRERGKKSSSGAFYWRWVEAGHLARGPGRRIKGGFRSKALQRARYKARGDKFVPGRKFILRAFQGKQQAAIDAFNKRLDARISKAEKELNGR